MVKWEKGKKYKKVKIKSSILISIFEVTFLEKERGRKKKKKTEPECSDEYLHRSASEQSQEPGQPLQTRSAVGDASILPVSSLCLPWLCSCSEESTGQGHETLNTGRKQLCSFSSCARRPHLRLGPRNRLFTITDQKKKQKNKKPTTTKYLFPCLFFAKVLLK